MRYVETYFNRFPINMSDMSCVVRPKKIQQTNEKYGHLNGPNLDNICNCFGKDEIFSIIMEYELNYKSSYTTVTN